MEPVIRSARLAPFRTRLSDAEVEALRRRVEAEVRAEWENERQASYEAERARARADGIAAAKEEWAAALDQAIAQARESLEARLTRALGALESAHLEALTRLERQVGEVSFAALCRLVGEQHGTRAFTLALIEQTCAGLRAESVATVRLHPRDIETLREIMQRAELNLRSLNLKVIPDESLTLGGCVVEMPSGQYDGGLENQLRRLHALLVGAPTGEAR